MKREYKITKHTSYQRTKPIRFGTKVTSSETLSALGFHCSDTYIRRY